MNPTYEYQSDFVRKFIHQGRAEGRAQGEAKGRLEGRAEGLVQGRAEGRAEGRVEGEVKAVLGVLESRGIELPERARERISGCANLDLLEGWLHRVATVKSVDELFN